MTSRRAAVTKTVFRHLFKNRFHPRIPVSVQRTVVEFAQIVMGRPARDVRLTPVEIRGVRCRWTDVAGVASDRVVVFLHGGGYVVGSLDSHRDQAIRFARATGARLLAVDYRLAPEHPFPAGIEDATAVYEWLIENGYPPAKIMFMGESAGGGLSAATMLNLRDRGTPMPAAAVLMSAWLDLALTGESMQTRDAVETVLCRPELEQWAGWYLNGTDAKTARASALYAELHGLPPLLIQVGTDEILFDDSKRFATRAKTAGVDVTYEEWDGMLHGWHNLALWLPEGRSAIERLGRYAREQFDRAERAADRDRRGAATSRLRDFEGS